MTMPASTTMGKTVMTLENDARASASFTLVVHGPDRPGLVAALATIVAKHDGNIVASDQYSDCPGGIFFQRVVVNLPNPGRRRQPLEHDLAAVAGEQFGLTWRLRDLSVPTRVAILASKSDHCLLDLLWRYRRREMPMTVPLIISNHPDVGDDVRSFGVPFHHVPSQGSDKSESEAAILSRLNGQVDLVVLARYMQILSSDFLDRVGTPVINIHHSFLPAFIGAGPYKMARERGVKLVGATAHYVTPELDEGPIIEQDVVRVSHRDNVAELTRRGANIERQVLSRAVRWHCQDRVIRHENQTIVF